MSADAPAPRGVETDDPVMTALERVDEQVQALPEGGQTRTAGLVLLGVGLASLFVPGALLRLVGGPLAWLLDASVKTSDDTPTRLRLLGLAMAAAGAHLAYHGSVAPVGFES